MIEKQPLNPQKRRVQVEFHALAAGGEAVGRDVGQDVGHDNAGKTVFAPFAAPGDLAWVELREEKVAFARGFIQQIDRVSARRVEPPCPQFRPEAPSRSCGGCSWQHVDLDAQRQAKREIVQNALDRIGGQSVEVEATRGGSGYNYRNKADFVIGRAQKEALIGFFATSSHDLIDAQVCPIQNPKNEEILRAAREILLETPHLAFDAHSGRGAWRRLVARVSSEGESLATLVLQNEAMVSSDQIRQIAHKLRDRLPHLVGVLAATPRAEPKTIWGRDYLVEKVNGLNFRVSGTAFWQVNTEISPHLALAALELSQVQRGEKALDLFCGAGFFALHLARAGAEVMGIEANRGAIKDAIWNLQLNSNLHPKSGVPEITLNAKFRAGDAARGLQGFNKGDFDFVLLDPPRAGARECIDGLIKIAPKRIVYISCDPATLARDAKILTSRGYHMSRAIPFDLFPQTAHVEVVTRFDAT